MQEVARTALREQRGLVTVAAAGMMAILAVLVLGCADISRVLIASARAQSAADAAALAAAQESALPSGSEPASAASGYATRNGASLSSCSCAAGCMEAVVEVRVPVGLLTPFPGDKVVTAQARAVVGGTARVSPTTRDLRSARTCPNAVTTTASAG